MKIVIYLFGGIFAVYSFNIFPQTSDSLYKIAVNKLKLPVNNKGNLGCGPVGYTPLEFEESSILFGGGFLLSGKTNDTIWANGASPLYLINDYEPGIVGSNQYDPINKLYILKSNDPPFGESWQSYSDAVSIGADYYDGDQNGNYNPIDLNGNGFWDLNEDRPDIIGDITVWCSYNDSKPAEQRRFSSVSPQGIEVHQTVFALGNNISGSSENIIFIRYRILNKGTVSSLLDSVYFGVFTDPDIGDASNDRSGCDTILKTEFAYNVDEDSEYGSNPPSFLTSILQGPQAYIPGETFIDINSNGIFEDSIDTPLDTAYLNNGLFIGSTSLAGARNQNISSSVFFIGGSPGFDEPNNENHARFYLQGFNKFGEIVDPCDGFFSEVIGVPCNLVNPFFWCSGDPVSNIGWINLTILDVRMMLSTGPFKLNENKPVDIWVAYIAGRGTDALNSITKGKEINQFAIDYYKSNFTVLPVEVKDENYLLTSYQLLQNYPNPFNPTTNIEFSIPDFGFVSLKVFDVLGREIITLANEEKPAGNYEIKFDASELPSGVYLYQIKVNDFIESKKMILLK